ncbi:MAG: helix-turn-helix transcriptional regulator [Proteobacteria bacterium]|nr:helix-turn-helix transcriptional regulator [Pseudomonadota bacterium]
MFVPRRGIGYGWPVDPQSIVETDGSFPRLMGGAISVVGRPEFFTSLCDCMRRVLPFSSSDLVIADLQAPHAPPVLVGVRAERGAYSKVIEERYLKWGYHFCPELAAIHSGRVNDIYSMSDLGAASFFEPECYNAYYGLLELKDFYDIFADLGDGRVAGWSICRRTDEADFSDAEDRRIRAIAPLFLGLLRRHCQLAYPERASVASPRRDFRSQILEALRAISTEPLTEREADVAILMSRGLSSKAASNTLGISPLTESVHRRNIFRKLRMSSQVEIVAYCLRDLLGVG